MPPDLGFHLPFLQELDMSYNIHAGPLPTSLSNCSHLTYLRLHQNHLSGSIPLQLGMLQNLQVLLLAFNNFRGKIPSSLGNCTNLLNLSFSFNPELTGSFPVEFGNLHYLQILSLQSCTGLTGVIPSSLANCTRLVLLDLSTNQLKGVIPTELGTHLGALEILTAASNNLTGTIPTSLGNCTKLTHLELSGNQLSGVIPTELGLLGDLSKLLLPSNFLAGVLPSSLGNCTSLALLDLRRNQLSGAIPRQFERLGPSMQSLTLAHNNLSGPVENLNLSSFAQLTMLFVSFNSLEGSLFRLEFSALSQLQFLGVKGNKLTGNIPWDSIANCSFLYAIDLGYNYLGGGISSSLAKLHALRYLFLGYNKLEGNLPDTQGFANLTLQVLDLEYNNLNGSLPSSLAPALSTLSSVLYLDGNRFSGPVPPWLGLAVEVQQIDLSNNLFTGSIPPSLGGCLALIALYFDHNRLSGELPEELGKLTSLEALDLSSNNFSGVLPSFLFTKMPSLQQVNVSFNNFTGSIPTNGSVFKYLNASYFQGNPGLCEPILHKHCDDVHTDKQIRGRKHHIHHLHRSRTWLIPLVILAVLVGIVLLLFAAHRCYWGRSRPKEHTPSSLAQGRHYTEKELMEATQGYSEVNVLGAGGLAVVYKGILSDGSVVAVKRFRDTYNQISHKALQQEMQILSKLRHRNLVRILGCVLNLDVKILVLEYMANGSLEQYLDWYKSSQRGSVGVLQQEEVYNGDVDYWKMVSKVAFGIGHALAYLHCEYGESIIHGDVKPGNVLLDANMEPHLADFGLARSIKRGADAVSLSSDFQGTIGYMAPEYGYATQVTTGVDVYSYGVILLRMLTGKSPLEVEAPHQNLHDWVATKILAKSSEEGSRSEEAVLDPALVLHRSHGGLSTSSDPYCSDTKYNIAGQAMQLLRIGLTCTSFNPDNRPSIQEVLTYICGAPYN